MLQSYRQLFFALYAENQHANTGARLSVCLSVYAEYMRQVIGPSSWGLYKARYLDELATVGNVNLDLATWKSATCYKVVLRAATLQGTLFFGLLVSVFFSTSLVFLACLCYKVVLRGTQRIA